MLADRQTASGENGESQGDIWTCKGIENNAMMGKDNSQFTTSNHIYTGQNKSVSTNSHENAGFIEF